MCNHSYTHYLLQYFSIFIPLWYVWVWVWHCDWFWQKNVVCSHVFRFSNVGHKDKSGQKWVLRVMIIRALYNINLLIVIEEKWEKLCVPWPPTPRRLSPQWTISTILHSMLFFGQMLAFVFITNWNITKKIHVPNCSMRVETVFLVLEFSLRWFYLTDSQFQHQSIIIEVQARIWEML